MIVKNCPRDRMTKEFHIRIALRTLIESSNTTCIMSIGEMGMITLLS